MGDAVALFIDLRNFEMRRLGDQELFAEISSHAMQSSFPIETSIIHEFIPRSLELNEAKDLNFHGLQFSYGDVLLRLRCDGDVEDSFWLLTPRRLP